jgi:exodeoxyribonuclease V beta subunit
MKLFDLINTPLSGPILIEASAGTGKTYTISGLYARLVIENGLSVDQILVVTYTTAATQELKTRIRQRLIQVRQGFTQGASDEFIVRLVDRISDRRMALQQIDSALADFDRAAIFTIHGFCQRLLTENTFETGASYDTSLVADPTVFHQEVAEDFWRKNFYTAEPEFIGFVYSIAAAVGPPMFYNLLQNINMPDLDVLPHIDKPRALCYDDYRTLFRQLALDWPACRSAVVEQLGSPALNAKIFGSLKPDRQQPEFSLRDLKVQTLSAAMDQFCRAPGGGFPPFNGIEKFSATYLENATRKGYPPPQHPFFSLCSRLHDASEALKHGMEHYFLYLKTAFLKYSRAELAVTKKTRNIIFYDDLLLSVRDALDRDSAASDRLIETVRRRFKTALVDEFQDTDSIQYDIFSKLFGKPPSTLFMIGDPKQSIYSFRGADIFSYMEAAARTESRYTLVENWRSDPGLIKAVNTLFGNVSTPFLYGEIVFEEGRAGGTLIDDTASTSPALSLWFLPKQGERPTSKTDAVRWITAAVGDEIVRLVTATTHRLKPEDIAVLVRTNRQARMMKDCLSYRRIPSVLYGAGNIFDTLEAGEVHRVLSGILEYSKDERFRAALATDMLGVRAIDLDTAADNPSGVDDGRNRFHEYLEAWRRRGFMPMFRWLMSREGVRARILAYPDGDRRLTNILHVAELLHNYAMETSAEAVDLLKWLSDQRKPGIPRPEEHQLRLENDVEAVRIVTIHKSKGLEYPVVFCPFGWESSLTRKNREVICHRNGPPRRRILDLGSAHYDEHVRKAQQENLAENLRLLYVALTRARSHCYLVWGHINTAETSALAYLLHRPPDYDGEDLVNALKSHVSKMSDTEIRADLERLAAKSEGRIILMDMPQTGTTIPALQEKAAGPLFCRSFCGVIDTSWKISSYTSLVSHPNQNDEQPDRDAPTERPVPPSNGDFDEEDPATLLGGMQNRTIYDFPRGARAGIFFHSLLEQLDFTQSDPTYQDRLIQANLNAHGFDSQWLEVVRATIQRVLSVPLLSGGGDLTIGSIGPGDRINELAFTYPLKPFTRYQLQEVFDHYRGGSMPDAFSQHLKRLDFSASGGFLKGFIDLVFQCDGRFFVLDWKSNDLGRRPIDYHIDNLQSVMSASYYILQYCLYALALHRYLAMHLPTYNYAEHFGGVFYVFIRGVDPQKGPAYGIYYDRPDVGLIQSLDNILIAEK